MTFAETTGRVTEAPAARPAPADPAGALRGIADARRRLFSAEEWGLIVSAGVFPVEERLELLEGDIVQMTPIGPTHSWMTTRLLQLLTERGAWGLGVIFVQSPVRIAAGSVPQPDLALVMRRGDEYRSRHPTAEEVFLIVEVMDSSSRQDRRVKLPRYASAGIREVWLVDVDARRIVVNRSPEGGRYAEERTFGPGERVACAAFPQLEIGVDEIFASS